MTLPTGSQSRPELCTDVSGADHMLPISTGGGIRAEKGRLIPQETGGVKGRKEEENG